MGSSFCDPTREICPFGSRIDPTLALVNNVYVRAQTESLTAPPGVNSPLPGGGGTAVGIRSAPITFQVPRIPLPGGGGITFPPIIFPTGPSPFQQPTRQPPPLTPGRIPPGPSVTNGCPPDPSMCCPKGFHADKKWGLKCVRNRRMNPLNPRALRRALRRVDQFENFVNRTAKLTGLRLAKKSTRRK